MNTDKIYAEKVANEYAPKETSKVKALKKLDHMWKVPVQVFAYIFGTVAALIMGVGMCLCLGEIGNGTALMMGLGVGIGLVGILLMSVNYPIYKKILSSRKEKYAADILDLANQISEEE